MTGPNSKSYSIAIVWRGGTAARQAATPQNNRFHRVFEELAALGIRAEPTVYDEDIADEVRDQLLAADGVLVWVDPIHEGKTREALDPLLREVAARGPWVSAHPDVILKMGVKEVLYQARHLGWGADTHLYRTAAQFAAEFPARLEAAGPRVLKQNRGNGGQGVWKVERLPGGSDRVRALHAQRGSVPEELPLREFMTRCDVYFGWGGCIIDQPFQPRLPEGMIRCYMGVDKVAGFGQQLIKALIPPPPEGPDAPAAQPGPRIMHGPDAAPFQALRAKMEQDWVPQMMTLLGINRAQLPIIWDADFLYGPPTAVGGDTYVLCEINVSSCFAIPDEAPTAIARLALERCRSSAKQRGMTTRPVNQEAGHPGPVAGQILLAVRELRTSLLQPASFNLTAGECIAIQGPSGSGKTLLLRALADLDPSDGEVYFEGSERMTMTGPAWRRQVGYLPAEPGWWADTVGAHFTDWPAALAVARQLGFVTDPRDWPIGRLSTGERLRLALVRALTVGPKVLLLDEPTAALDAAAIAAVEALIAVRLETGLGVLWVTHDEAQARRIAVRRLVVSDRRVQEEAAACPIISR